MDLRGVFRLNGGVGYLFRESQLNKIYLIQIR